MSDKYAFNVDVVMLIMSSVLVVSASLNEKILMSASTFKTNAQGKPKGNGLTLGMTPEGVHNFDTIMGILGAAAAGAYGLSMVYKKKGGVSSPKSPRVYTAVFGFAVALSMLLSGLVGKGVHQEVAAFRANTSKSAKTISDVSISVTVLGSVALVLMLILVFKKSSGGGRFRFSGGGLSGGRGLSGGANAMSTFFTY